MLRAFKGPNPKSDIRDDILISMGVILGDSDLQELEYSEDERLVLARDRDSSGAILYYIDAGDEGIVFSCAYNGEGGWKYYDFSKGPWCHHLFTWETGIRQGQRKLLARPQEAVTG